MRLRHIVIPVLGAVAAGLLAFGGLDDHLINSRGSIFLNIDSDHNEANQVLEIARDTTENVGGTALVTVLENGNVGIGTTSPSKSLSVFGGAIVDGANAQNGTNQALALTFGNPGSQEGIASKRTAGGNQFGLDFYTQSFASPRMSITQGGNVGIGTTSPLARLHVAGSGANTGLLFDNGGDLMWRSTTNQNVPILTLHTDNDVYLDAPADAGSDMHFRTGASDRMTILTNGNVGIGTSAPGAQLDVNGTTRTDVLEIVGADLAEKFPVSESVEPGMVVEIDPDHPGQLGLARGAYNRRVAGVVSGANNLPAGAILGHLPGKEDAPAIALTGRVWVWCDARFGAIEPGDLLTTSDTPGHAMKVTDYITAQGAILGKAMTSLQEGRGLVLVLVSLQ